MSRPFAFTCTALAAHAAGGAMAPAVLVGNSSFVHQLIVRAPGHDNRVDAHDACDRQDSVPGDGRRDYGDGGRQHGTGGGRDG